MIGFWLLFQSCGSGQDSGVDCDSVPTYANWAQGFLNGKCQSCHHSENTNRHGAPADIYFDTHEDTIRWLYRIEATIFQEGSMPPNGGVNTEELELLRQWLNCEAQ